MKVLLVSTNRCDAIVPPFPLGVALVAANLDASRHEVQIWDAMFEEPGGDSLRERIRAFAPDVIGLSIRNVDDQDMRAPRFLLDEVRDLVAVCRAESSAPLIGGGAGFGMFPVEITRYLGLDYGIMGEGERAFPQLLDRLADGRTPADVPGAVCRDGEHIRTAPPAWTLPLDELAPAARTAPDMQRYYESRGTAGFPNAATIQSKRGCPLSCTYCATFAIEGQGIRVRSPQGVADEVEALRAQGFERVQFVDSLFTNPVSHARAACEELIRRGSPVHWSATVSPAHADESLLDLMRRAGCVLVMVGNESGCSRTLATLGKGFAPADVERCFAACERVGLRYNAYLLLGAPGEDPDSVRESVDLVQRYQPTLVSVSIGIRLYPGCGLTRVAEDEGQLAPGADLVTPRFYLAAGVRDWIWDYMDPIVERTANWVY